MGSRIRQEKHVESSSESSSVVRVVVRVVVGTGSRERSRAAGVAMADAGGGHDLRDSASRQPVLGDEMSREGR